LFSSWSFGSYLGMAEIRMGVSIQSALDKVKHKKAMAKKKKKVRR
jgi:hypothetical protein